MKQYQILSLQSFNLSMEEFSNLFGVRRQRRGSHTEPTMTCLAAIRKPRGG